MEKKCFAVTAKCGHVGRQFYYKGTFYIRAFTKREAAVIARNTPRVKHDHKDAILRVEEITINDYKAGQESFQSEAYFQCDRRRQQGLFWDEIAPNLRPETDITHSHRQKIGYEKREYEPRIKKPYKREKFILCEDDLDNFAS